MTTMNIHICMYIIIIPFRNEVKASYNRIQPSSAHSYIHYLTATIIIENTSETTFGLLDLSSSVLCCMAESKVPPHPLTTDCIVPAYK